MKKTLILGALVVGSLSAYSQGTVNFVDRTTDMTIHIYAPQLLLSSSPMDGNANSAVGVTADLYANNGTDGNYAGSPITQLGTTGTVTTGGNTIYTGGAIGNTNPGNPTPAGAYNYNNGNDYTVELYAAPGLNAAQSALLPVAQYTTTIFTSSTLGGAFRNVNVASDPGIPLTAGGSATIALYCWYNNGGTLTYAQSLALGDPTGISLLDNISALGNTGSPPGPAVNMEGLESFSLTVPLATVPEPSTIALGVIGASAFLFRRRK